MSDLTQITDIDAAIALSANTPPAYGSGDLGDLLAEKARREEASDPALKAKRLRVEAESLWLRAEHLHAEAAEYYGKAEYRISQGQEFTGASYERQGDARSKIAKELEELSIRAALDAAVIEGEISRNALLADVVSGAA